MSQVNFISQHRLFMEYGKRNKLSSHERLFYMALFYCANNLAMQSEYNDWPEDYFPVSNSELNGWTGFDDRAIRNLRNSLKQKGLLDFRKGDGKKKDPEYRIFYLRRIDYRIEPDKREIGNKFVPDNATDSKNAVDRAPTDCEFAPDSVGDSVGDHVGDSVATDCEFAPDNALSTYDYIKINKNQKEKLNRDADIVSNRVLSERNDAIRSDSEDTHMMQAYERIIRQNIAYDDLMISQPDKKETVDGMVEIMLENMMCKSKVILIAQKQQPADLVKSRMMKVDYHCICYILESLESNTTDVRNMKQYLAATLFNAPSTMDAHYSSAVRHDMPWLAR